MTGTSSFFSVSTESRRSVRVDDNEEMKILLEERYRIY